MSGNGPPRSLFGGPLSTRRECTNWEALHREKARLEAEAAAKAKKAAKKQQQAIGKPPGQNRPKEGQPSSILKETPELKKKRLYQEALDDFDDLLTDGPVKPKPKPAPPKPPPQQQQQQQQQKQQQQQQRQQQQPQLKSKQRPLPHQASNGTSKPGLPMHKLQPQSKQQQQQQQQQQQRPRSTLVQSSKGVSPSKPAAASPNGKPVIRPAPKPVRKQEPDFDKEDRLAMERARNSLSRDAAFARRRAELKRRQAEPDSEEEDDDFVVDDDEEDEPEWRKELRALTSYDPRKFQNERFDDRSMEAGYNDILAEERRSAKVARAEEKREEEEERKRLEAKAKAKKQKT